MSEKRVTKRGFQIVLENDANMEPFEIQQSSAIDDTERGMENPGSSFLWIGQPESRMHLHRDQVLKLIAMLRTWHETGMLFDNVQEGAE